MEGSVLVSLLDLIVLMLVHAQSVKIKITHQQDRMINEIDRCQFWALSQTRGNMPHCINFASLNVSFASLGYAGKGIEVGLTLIQYLFGVGFGTICPMRTKVTKFSVLMGVIFTLQPLDYLETPLNALSRVYYTK